MAALTLENLSTRTTDGEIAVINLQSERRAAWARFTRDARSPGAVEAVVDRERMTGQFLSDPYVLDRLQALAAQSSAVGDSFREFLTRAQAASTGHRFTEARAHLARAAQSGGDQAPLKLLSLAIDQACGTDLDSVLAARRKIAGESRRFEDQIPLGALLADLEQFTEADSVYRDAFDSYDGISPFPPAWACFQMGLMWGELVPIPDLSVAADWYRRAIAYLPAYVKARLHLAEICMRQDATREAEALLTPAMSSGDPEVRWRFADVLRALGRPEEAQSHLVGARLEFESLLQRHPLAYADHAAEFYAGSGNDHRRALELALANAANRPTRRALRRAREIAAI